MTAKTTQIGSTISVETRKLLDDTRRPGEKVSDYIEAAIRDYAQQRVAQQRVAQAAMRKLTNEERDALRDHWGRSA